MASGRQENESALRAGIESTCWEEGIGIYYYEGMDNFRYLTQSVDHYPTR